MPVLLQSLPEFFALHTVLLQFLSSPSLLPLPLRLFLFTSRFFLKQLPEIQIFYKVVASTCFVSVPEAPAYASDLQFALIRSLFDWFSVPISFRLFNI